MQGSWRVRGGPEPELPVKSPSKLSTTCRHMINARMIHERQTSTAFAKAVQPVRGEIHWQPAPTSPAAATALRKALDDAGNGLEKVAINATDAVGFILHSNAADVRQATA